MSTATVITGLPLPAPFVEAFRDAMEKLGEGPLSPAIDLFMTPDVIVAKVALPGVPRANVDVLVADRVVTVSGTTGDEAGATTVDQIHRELQHGPFGRSFWLPVAVRADRAKAVFKDGLLTLSLPKAQEPSEAVVHVPLTSGQRISGSTQA